MENSSGNYVPLGINFRENGDFSKKKEKTQNIVFELSGQQGAKTVCIKTSIKRLCKEITLDDDAYVLEKKYSMAVQDLSKEKLRTSHICTPPPKGFNAPGIINGPHSTWGAQSWCCCLVATVPAQRADRQRYGCYFWGMEGGGRRRNIRN